MNDALRRWSSRQPDGSVAPLASAGQKTDDSEWTSRCQIWWQKPDCWREEEQVRKGPRPATLIRVICRDKFWLFNSHSKTLHTNVAAQANLPHVRAQKRSGSLQHHIHRIEDAVNNVPPLTDPSFLLAGHDLEPIEYTTHAGREAVRVRALYQPGKETVRDRFFWEAADEYDLLVDKERGILLRYAAIIKENAFAVAAVKHVTFDEPIPDNVFYFTPESDTIVQIVT
jgi:hypothetical protein